MNLHNIDREATSWEQVAADLLHSEWQVRVAATKALTRFPERVSPSVLMLALTDEHKAVRVSALETCAELTHRIPVALVSSMLLDPEWSVRAAAAWAPPQIDFIHSHASNPARCLRRSGGIGRRAGLRSQYRKV